MMADYLREHGDCVLVYAKVENIDERGRSLGLARQVEPFNYGRLLNDVDLIAQPATMFRKSAYERVGGLDASMRWAFDYDLWLKLGRNGNVAYLEQVLAQARIHSEAKTVTGGLARLIEIERVARTHGRRSIPNGFSARMFLAKSRAAIAALRQRRPTEAAGESISAFWHLGVYTKYRLGRLLHKLRGRPK